MEPELEDALHSGSGVYVEAPAGHGKTFIILNTISRYPLSRQLVLTHTVAGVAALRSQMLKRGLRDENVSINTIAGWTQRFVRSYPGLADVELQQLDDLNASPSTTNQYWQEVCTAFIRLLSKRNIVEIIKANYDGVYIDEYQDCSNQQHELVVKLSAILPVRIMGDPLQGIFDFNDEMVSWDEVSSCFAHLATLEKPYRWINAENEVYGRWLLEIREKLKNNQPINLGEAPDCVSIEITGINPTEDNRRIIAKAKARLAPEERRLIIGDKTNITSKTLIKSLSTPRYTLIESLDSKEVKSLLKFAAVIDDSGRDSRIEFVNILAGCFTGLGQIKNAAERLRTDPNYNPREKIFIALKQQQNEFNTETALRLLKAIDSHQSTSCHRRQLFSILEMSFANKITGAYETLTDSMVASIESIRQRGRKLPKYSLGSTLLVKGLEVEEVILLDAQALKKQDLYVALSRPTKRITIFTRSGMLVPR
jgi:superfamily I DNA/RNA helicase